MRRQAVRLVEIITNPFMGYLAPQFEDSFSYGCHSMDANMPAFNPEKLYLLIFVLALAFIAVISPILCLGSLFFKLQLEGLWYFWLITFSETGYLLWLLTRKKARK